MSTQTDDVRIKNLKPRIPPAILMEEYPLDDQGAQLIAGTRGAVVECCKAATIAWWWWWALPIHDSEAACTCRGPSVVAKELQEISDQRAGLAENPTIVGWKGMINDPYLDGSYAINDGLRKARAARYHPHGSARGQRCWTPFLAVHRRFDQLGCHRRAHEIRYTVNAWPAGARARWPDGGNTGKPPSTPCRRPRTLLSR